MTPAVAFSYKGGYRVQSFKKYVYSELAGSWLIDASLINQEIVNRALKSNSKWRGGSAVKMQAALVSHRAGLFASEQDILYKREFFLSSGQGLPDVDLIDVWKSRDEWNRRSYALEGLFDRHQLDYILDRIGRVEEVIVNEYFLHEAGHLVGIDVNEKYSRGYFRQGGEVLWPLIYAEEFRADLNSFGFAQQILSDGEAERIFLYNIMLRFGAHRDGLASKNQNVYGIVPYLLCSVLVESGILTIDRDKTQFYFNDLNQESILEAMKFLADHASFHLTEPEFKMESMVDLSIHIARYLRWRLSHSEMRKKFSFVMEGAFQ